MEVRLEWPSLTPVELLGIEATSGCVCRGIHKDVDLHGCRSSCLEMMEYLKKFAIETYDPNHYRQLTTIIPYVR